MPTLQNRGLSTYGITRKDHVRHVYLGESSEDDAKDGRWTGS